MLKTEKEIKIHISDIADKIFIEDVDEAGSINPRLSLSVEHIVKYARSIVNYLDEGSTFDASWNQTPQVIELPQEDVDGDESLNERLFDYTLVSGFHTVSALLAVLEGHENGEVMVDDEADEETHLATLDMDFEVTFEVIEADENIDWMDAARYSASFSNLHGKSLTSGEKFTCAYNALQSMNLSKDEGNISLFPHIDDRKLAGMLDVSKGTVYNARKKVREERFGPPETEATEEPDTPQESQDESEPGKANLKADVEALEAAAAQDSADMEDRDAQDGGVDTETLGDLFGEDTEDADSDDKIDDAEKEVLKNTITELLDNNEFPKLKTLVKLRETLDFILEIDEASLTKSIGFVEEEVIKLRQNFSDYMVKQDSDYSKGVVEIFTMFLVLLENVSDEKFN